MPKGAALVVGAVAVLWYRQARHEAAGRLWATEVNKQIEKALREYAILTNKEIERWIRNANLALAEAQGRQSVN
jgi:hypothetical protein